VYPPEAVQERNGLKRSLGKRPHLPLAHVDFAALQGLHLQRNTMSASRGQGGPSTLQEHCQ
jgi:hypothetical protein